MKWYKPSIKLCHGLDKSLASKETKVYKLKQVKQLRITSNEEFVNEIIEISLKTVNCSKGDRIIE